MKKDFDLALYIEEIKSKLEHLEHQYKMTTDEKIKESILKEIDSITEEINILEDH